ncbi:MAG TPA: TlpA disulfide reductase family protein [Chloroflexota bacterium]|nr:TlpA disulfide reductase family protein [Chloroflexota bacterium]
MAASTPTLDSDLAAVAARRAPADASAVRLGLVGLTLVAVVVFALYAAYLASRVEEVTAPEAFVMPTGGASSPLGLGQRAPDFVLTDMDGRTSTLSDYAGTPVWINVWASWCAPCRAEAPDIDAVYRQANEQSGVRLLMVSLDPDPAAVRRYLSTVKYGLPVFVDPAARITERYRITGLPTHYFIDRQGVIRDLAIGGLKPKGMRSRLAKIV